MQEEKRLIGSFQNSLKSIQMDDSDEEIVEKLRGWLQTRSKKELATLEVGNCEVFER